MVILIWWFVEFAFIHQIKCTHSYISMIFLYDLDSLYRQTKLISANLHHIPLCQTLCPPNVPCIWYVLNSIKQSSTLKFNPSTFNKVISVYTTKYNDHQI